MEIGILSDSHFLSGEIRANIDDFSVIMQKLKKAFVNVSMIFHAGDITCPEFLTELEKIAKIYVVRGNTDEENNLMNLPRILIQEVETIPIGLAHRSTDLSLFPPNSLRVFISGHTHVPLIQENEQGVLLINPGSIRYPRTPPLKKNFPQSPTAQSSIALLTIQEGLITAIIKYI